jgi:hypothetical protein
VADAPSPSDCPPVVAEFAGRTVDYVERAVGVRLAFDSETLPLLDHYLRGVPTDKPEPLALVAATAGAYFGEVVRHHLGGRWESVVGDPIDWRFILPTALTIRPGQFVLAAIAGADVEGDSDVGVPAVLADLVEDALRAMADVPEDVYYSLCGRLDALEHLHEVVAALAAQKLGDAATPDPD